jgi:hypothetical protein
MNNRPSMALVVGRGVVAGTAVMTVFQKLVEMPFTGRSDSFVPAELAETVLRVRPATRRGRTVLNYTAHFSLGTMWGAAYGLAAYAGLRGVKAAAAVYGVAYPADVLGSTALVGYQPSTWSRRDWVTDAGEKLIQAVATALVFDKTLDPTRTR